MSAVVLVRKIIKLYELYYGTVKHATITSDRTLACQLF